MPDNTCCCQEKGTSGRNKKHIRWGLKVEIRPNARLPCHKQSSLYGPPNRMRPRASGGRSKDDPGEVYSG